MMADELPPDRPLSERVRDIKLIERALRRAVREALLRHKQAGNPIAVWRDGMDCAGGYSSGGAGLVLPRQKSVRRVGKIADKDVATRNDRQRDFAHAVCAAKLVRVGTAYALKRVTPLPTLRGRT